MVLVEVLVAVEVLLVDVEVVVILDIAVNVLIVDVEVGIPIDVVLLSEVDTEVELKDGENVALSNPTKP